MMFLLLFAQGPRDFSLAGAPETQVRPEPSLPVREGLAEAQLATSSPPFMRSFSQNAALLLLDYSNIFILHE